jgi:hypothetical protein
VGWPTCARRPKIERWHGSLKAEAIRRQTPLSLADARRVVGHFVEEYNTQRLHSAIGYVTPHDRLAERPIQIWEERDRKPEVARARRAASANRRVNEPRWVHSEHD